MKRFRSFDISKFIYQRFRANYLVNSEYKLNNLYTLLSCMFYPVKTVFSLFDSKRIEYYKIAGCGYGNYAVKKVIADIFGDKYPNIVIQYGDDEGGIGLHIPLPLLHRRPPLQENGRHPGLGQNQRAEEARAAGAHDDGAPRSASRRRRKAEWGFVDSARVLLEARARARSELGAQRERELDVISLAGVYRAATTLDAHDVLLAYAQASREGVPTRPNLLRVRAIQLR